MRKNFLLLFLMALLPLAGWAYNQDDVSFTLSPTTYDYTGNPVNVTITDVRTTADGGSTWTAVLEDPTELYYANAEIEPGVYGPGGTIGVPFVPGTYWLRVQVGTVTSTQAERFTISAPAAPVISLAEDVTDYNGSNTPQPTIAYSANEPADPVYSITFTPYHGNTATALEAEALTSLAQIRNAGTYAIKVKEGEYGNWSNEVTYTVNPAQLLLMVTTTQQPYGSAASDDIIKYAITGTLKQGDVTSRLTVDGLHFLTVGNPTTAVGTSYTYSITTDDAWATITLSSAPEATAYENYVPYVTNQATVTIVKAAATITVNAPDDVTFGDAEPTYTAEVTGVKAGETLSYTIARENAATVAWPVNVGSYNLVVTYEENEGYNKNYNITVAPDPLPTLTVNKKEVAAADFTINGILTIGDEPQVYVYKRAAWEPVPTSVTVGNFTLAASDYTLSYDNNLNASTTEAKAKVIIELAEGGNFEYADDNKASQEFTINPRDVAECKFNNNAFGNKAYTGSQITVNNGDRLYWPSTGAANRLTAETDFTYEWGENVNVGEGSITFTGVGNWTGTTTKKFNIVARPVVTEETLYAGLAFANYDDKPYTGVQIKPETTGKVTFTVGTADPVALVEGTDYNVEYGANIAAGANSGSVTYTFIKNFSGSYTKNFNITPAALIITANDVNVNYGTAVPAFTVTYDGFISPENENTPGIFGESVLAFKVKSVDSEEAGAVDSYASVGTYYIWPEGLESTNYAITFKSGKLTVAAPQLTIVSNDAEKTYGDADPDEFTYKIVDGLGNEVTTISFDGGDGYTAPTLTRAEGENVNAAGYVITPSGAVHPNYTFAYAATGKLTIKPRPIQVNVKPQTIDYGADIEKTSISSDYWTFVTDDWNGNTEDTKADLNLVLSTVNAIDTYVPGSTTANAIKATISNTNYVLTNTDEQWGTLIINEVSEIVLDPTQDMANDINNFNGKTVKVKFANMTMKAKEWYAIVLPFATTPAELVKGLGQYVVCNVLNTTASTDQNFKFTLEMDELPAGVPFLIKPAQNLDWAGFDLGMEVTTEEPSDPVAVKKTIVSAITDAVAEYESKELVRFTGSYTSQHLQGLKNDNGGEKVWWLANSSIAKPNTDPVEYYDNNWKKPKTNPRDTKPMEAYLIGGEGWTTYAPNFTVEDFDGQTTSIKTLGAESIHNMLTEGWYTLNGVKLQSAPTQKGVYINNGKKVVIR